MLRGSCAVAALVAMPLAAEAQEQPAPPPAAQGQSAPAQDQDAPIDEESGEIVVTGVVRGEVKTDIKPEAQLNAADIQAYGASNVSDLLNSLSAQLGSGQGRGDEQPVILLSGRRSSFREIGSLPTEAIERVDIFPEEVALQYGYSASQKVINFVLRRRFQALTAQLGGGIPTEGGNSTQNGEMDIVKIRRDTRVELDVNYNQSSALMESERGVTRAASSLFDTRGNITGFAGGEIDPALSALAGSSVTVAGAPDAAAGGAQPLAAYAATANDPNVTDLTPYRTLRGPQKKLSMKGTYQRAFSQHVQGTASLQLDVTESQSLQGLPGVTLRLPAGNPYSPFSQDVQLLRYLDTQSPLQQSSSGQSLQGEFNLNSDVAPWSRDWNWSLQGEYQRSTDETLTDMGVDPVLMQQRLDAGDPAFNPFAPIPLDTVTIRPANRASSTRSQGTIDFLTNGPLFSLPAGKANASIRVRGRTQDQSGDALNRGVRTVSDISRDTIGVRGNINLPITSRRYGVLDAIGDLTLNANFEVEQHSDFGRLVATGYGFNWRPIQQVQLRINWNEDSNAPSPQQLGNPTINTPNVPIFDYVRGETVEVTRITGGNPLLRADSRHVFNAGLNIQPFSQTNLTIRANYSNQRFRNSPQSFPDATAEIQAAFPERFVRDADGDLISVDYRPINTARRDTEQLRWGFTLSLPIPSPQVKRLQARRDAFRKAYEESRRTGQPMPPEFTAQLEQFRRIGQQGSLFGGNQQQRGPGQGFRQAQQGQAQEGQAPPREGQGAGEGPRGGRQFRGGGGGRGGFGGGRGGNRVFVNAFHTWVFKDELLIRPGVPLLDRLNGAAGSRPAHQIDLQAGIKRDMLNLVATGTWQSATHVDSGALGSGDRLDFGSLAKVNLQAEVNFGQNVDLLLKHPWLRGSRVTFNVDNLFNVTQRVTDQNGLTPAAYAPRLIDPLGRVVRLTFRKQFF